MCGIGYRRAVRVLGLSSGAFGVGMRRQVRASDEGKGLCDTTF
jgi:hypothetical protein